MKMITLALILILFSVTLKAPDEKFAAIVKTEAIKPFKPLIFAIGSVECDFDTLAYNSVEQATGYFQIRPIRVNYYNKRTGNNYTLNEMYDYDKAEKVFLYYASRIGPYDQERIIRNWNGKWSLTDEYYAKVNKVLKSNN